MSEIWTICDDKNGLPGKRCPADGKVDYTINGAIRKSCEIAAEAGCKNAKNFLEYDWMTHHCFVQHKRVGKDND